MRYGEEAYLQDFAEKIFELLSNSFGSVVKGIKQW